MILLVLFTCLGFLTLIYYKMATEAIKGTASSGVHEQPTLVCLRESKRYICDIK